MGAACNKGSPTPPLPLLSLPARGPQRERLDDAIVPVPADARGQLISLCDSLNLSDDAVDMGTDVPTSDPSLSDHGDSIDSTPSAFGSEAGLLCSPGGLMRVIGKERGLSDASCTCSTSAGSPTYAAASTESTPGTAGSWTPSSPAQLCARSLAGRSATLVLQPGEPATIPVPASLATSLPLKAPVLRPPPGLGFALDFGLVN